MIPMTRNRRIAVGLLALVAVAAASCGNDAGSSSTATSGPETSAASETTTAAGETSYAVVDTGQVRCYDDAVEITCPAAEEAFFGQDAEYGGNAPSYTDNGDGTVTDKVTGLVWQQVDNGEGVDWGSALSYCDALALGGETDWRLPDAKTLQSIVDYSRPRTPPTPPPSTRCSRRRRSPTRPVKRTSPRTGPAPPTWPTRTTAAMPRT